MVHDELEDFATPVKAQCVIDAYVYDNEQFNNEESDSDEEEMDYNYDDEYFYWLSSPAMLQNQPLEVKISYFFNFFPHGLEVFCFCKFIAIFLTKKLKKKETKMMKNNFPREVEYSLKIN